MKKRNYLKMAGVFLILIVCILLSEPHVTKAEAISKATPYTVGTNITGALAEGGEDQQYYMFNLQSSGAIHLTGSAYMNSNYVYIYDESALELWSKTCYWNSTSEVISYDETIYLTSGTYYFCIRKSNYYGSYNLNISFESSNETFIEKNGGSNNSLNDANTINVHGTTYIGQMAINDEKDFYKFDLTNSGKVSFNATFLNMEYVSWKIYGQDGFELCSEQPYWNSTTKNIAVDEDIYLNSGSYYLVISERYERYGKYSFSLTYTSSNETFSEKAGGSNNGIETASELILSHNYNGVLTLDDDKDFYRFTVGTSQTLTIVSDLQMEYAGIKLYDSNGNEIWSESPYWNSITQTISFSRKTVLERGTYYLAIVQSYGRCGNYTLSISPLTQENCSHDEYDQQWVDATYFSKGYTKHTCKDCGYTYKDNYQPVKKLSQEYLYSYCSSGKGSLTVYWDTQSDASGYQIRLCRGKNFGSGVITKTVNGSSKSSYTIKKLSRNKKYYVQIRSYKKSGKKTVYGKWSEKRVYRTK